MELSVNWTPRVPDCWLQVNPATGLPGSGLTVIDWVFEELPPLFVVLSFTW